MSQREELARELRSVNYNEGSFMNKESSLKMEIANIDTQISMHLSSCEQA